jgi:hypothetical protein
MITKNYDRIYNKLRDNAALRDSDKLLQISIWREDGLYLTPEQEQAYMKVTPAETIRRTRQIIQAEGYFPSSKKVLKERKKLESQVSYESNQGKHESSAVGWLYD